MHILHIQHVIENWSFYTTQVPCQYRLYRADHAYLTYFMLQRQLNHLNGRKLDCRQALASYILYAWLHLVVYREHVHSHDSVWLLLVACTILLYSCINTDGWKLCANRGPVCTLENFQWGGEPCFACAAILRGGCLPLIPRRDKHKSSLIWSKPYEGVV
jgi:hypothetical protein